MATTGMCDSFKVELFSAGHCLNQTFAAMATTHTNTLLDGLASTAGIVRGMSIVGGDIGANCVVASIIDNASLTMSVAASGSTTGIRTFTADALKLLLIKASPVRTFDHTQTNVGTPGASAPSASNVGTDEVAATGNYTSGGLLLLNGVPQLSSTTAVATFPTGVSWTSATITTTAAVIYNTSVRLGSATLAQITGRTVSVHDFGGPQTVTAGTLTLVMPTADATTGLLRIS